MHGDRLGRRRRRFRLVLGRDEFTLQGHERDPAGAVAIGLDIGSRGAVGAIDPQFRHDAGGCEGGSQGRHAIQVEGKRRSLRAVGRCEINRLAVRRCDRAGTGAVRSRQKEIGERRVLSLSTVLVEGARGGVRNHRPAGGDEATNRARRGRRQGDGMGEDEDAVVVDAEHPLFELLRADEAWRKT